MEVQPREIRRYIISDGRVPFAEWIDSLRDRNTRAKINDRLRRVSLGNLGDYRSVGEGVFELRIDWGPGYRVYFGQIGLTIVLLLCGGDKSTQDRDILKRRSIGQNMKNVITQTSDSWLNALIESLKKPAEAAAYLSVALEAESPDSQLLRAEIQDVIDAGLLANNLSKQAQLHHEKLDKMLSESGASEIYTLIALLDALGFRLRVTLKEDELAIGNEIDRNS